MLDVSHITKKYGKLAACDDVNFHLDPGSVTVLLGPNGAGTWAQRRGKKHHHEVHHRVP